MNFGKLLAVGKSMVNSRAEVAYRADKQFYLPKFGPTKNPFTKTSAETAPEERKKEEKVTAREDARPTIPGQGQTQARPATAKTAGGEVKEERFAIRGVIARPGIARPAADEPVVQSELSLDTVKVLHNDLSDAEVEVVPLKSRSGVADLPPAKKSWEILGERLLRATAL